jgi:glycosyltransferase involved in cell wall biosynthesis
MVILQNTIRERDVLITAMKNTRGWRMLEKFRRIRDRIFVPLSGKSERDQRAVEKAVESRTAEAPAYIGEKAGGFRSGNRKIITLNNVVHDPILSMVSVVIPTKNAGEEFEYALRRIKQQEGIQEIEIVIVDSGSTDRTIDLASRYSEKVLRVAPEDFHHARTRNLGAERAAGDFVVFTVQDAVPVSNYWLYRLVSPLYKGEASAVSARQIPRSDADLFASWAMWVHNHYLGYDHDRMISRSIFRNFDSLDLQEKRSAAGLDSVCLGIKKSVFDQYLFRSGYGEDLDLGVRLLKDNHTMLFQFSNGVIHSHNRPALYYLKRGYIDTIYLWKILDIERKNIPSRPVLEAISYLYGLLKACLFTLKVEYEFNKEPVSLIHSFLNNFEGRLATSSSRGDSGNNVGEPQLDSFFEQFLPNSHQHISSEIYSAMRGSLLSFSDFMKSFTSVDGMKEDFLRSIYKIFSNTAGYYLGANTRDAIDALEGSI